MFPTIFLHSSNPVESFPCRPIFSHTPPSTKGAEVGVAVGVGVGVAVGVGDGVGVALGELLGFGAATTTPLFHTNFLPLLIQVYFFPETVDVEPSFEQADPALTAAWATEITKVKESATARIRRAFLMSEI